jgi:hypothetical protein
VTVRSDERNEFLTDILTTAVENGGHGWFSVDEYQWEAVPAGGAYATVADDEGEIHRIDLDVLERGLQVIRDAVLGPDHLGGQVLHNATSGCQLYVSPVQRTNICLADRTNGDEGDLDCIDALAIVECGLFGRVVYA